MRGIHESAGRESPRPGCSRSISAGNHLSDKQAAAGGSCREETRVAAMGVRGGSLGGRSGEGETAAALMAAMAPQQRLAAGCNCTCVVQDCASCM